MQGQPNRELVSENGEINNEVFSILPELMEQRRKDPQDDLITASCTRRSRTTASRAS